MARLRRKELSSWAADKQTQPEPSIAGVLSPEFCFSPTSSAGRRTYTPLYTWADTEGHWKNCSGVYVAPVNFCSCQYIGDTIRDRKGRKDTGNGGQR